MARGSLRLLPPLLSVFAISAMLILATVPILAGTVEVTPLPPVEHPDGRSGTCFSYYPNDPHGNHPYLPLVYDAGSRWDRFDFQWAVLEPVETVDGGWDSGVRTGYDVLVNDLHAAGMNMVGILLWTPSWVFEKGEDAQREAVQGEAHFPQLAVTAPAGVSSDPPPGLEQEWDDWTEEDGDAINYWGRFVHKIVSRYGDRVKYWEMWNEPEWSQFWTGTSAEYAQLLKVGYQATKDACPDCTVLFGGLHYWEEPSYFRWVLSALDADPEAAQHNHFFDVMSVHLYSRSASIYDEVENIRSGMRAYGVADHPIWLTETGAPVWDDATVDPDPTKDEWSVTQEEAAAFVIQSYANAWAAGVEKYFFFRTNDQDMGEYFGLIRNDQTLRPAYVAYQVAAGYMISPTLVSRQVYTDGARSVTLWGTPHGKLSVLWNTAPISHTRVYSGVLPSATLLDRWGVTQTITATVMTTESHGMNHPYTLTLPGATANRLPPNEDDYIIGGEPYLLIEADTTPPTATLQPLLSPLKAQTIPIFWDGDDDAAGLWGVDIQVREGPTDTVSGTLATSQDAGLWSDWLSFTETEQISSAQYVDGQHGQTYCFRARAWDRAGNRGAWPEEAQACTTLDLMREVHFKLADVFGDEDSDGVWGTEEITLTEMSLRLVDAGGMDAVKPTVGSSWEFTATLKAGDYTLIIAPLDWPAPPGGWMPRRLPVSIEFGDDVQEIALPPQGLLPHCSSAYLPSVMQGGGGE